MNEKDYLRKILQENQSSFVPDTIINSHLDELTIYNSKDKLDMHQFYECLFKIINFNNLNAISPQNLHSPVIAKYINTILNVIHWATNRWSDGLVSGDLNKLVISYILIDKSGMSPLMDLNWTVKSEKLSSRVTKAITIIKLDITVGMDYSDQKTEADYKEALAQNDYKGVIAYLAMLERSSVYFSEEPYFKTISLLAFSIDPVILTTAFKNYSPYLIKLIMSFFEPKQIIRILSVYCDESPLPCLIGLLEIINPTGNNRYDKALENDQETILCASTIVTQISERVATDKLFELITQCSNIFMNNLWHGIYSAFLATHTKYWSEYIQRINFTDDVGENSFFGFSIAANESTVNDFSIVLYARYFDCLKEVYNAHFFCFTSYYKYIFIAMHHKSNSVFSSYLIQLEKASTDLRRNLYSWEPQERYKYFSAWIYWVICSKEISREQEIIDTDIPNTIKLLNDQRIYHILDCQIQNEYISFHFLKNILYDPATVSSIMLPFTNRIITFMWPT